MKDLWKVLRKRFPANEYALMEEVSDAAGFYRSNSADYIAVNLYPSRGLHLNGIELKSFRGDWLKELKNPAKAENIFRYCDYFWLLTTDETIAKLEEIPDTWGWMTVKGERIYTKKNAPKLTPEPVDRHFLAALLKRASNRDNFVHKDSIESEISTSYKKGYEARQSEIERAREELSELRDQIKEFEKASGINIFHRYGADHNRIGRAIRSLLNGGADETLKRLLLLKNTAADISQHLSENIEAFEAIIESNSNPPAIK